jgi:hypothetical protein
MFTTINATTMAMMASAFCDSHHIHGMLCLPHYFSPTPFVVLRARTSVVEVLDIMPRHKHKPLASMFHCRAATFV